MSKPTFEAGIAWTLAELVRMMHIDTVEVRNILEGAGYTLSSLRKKGAAQEDIDALVKVLNPPEVTL